MAHLIQSWLFWAAVVMVLLLLTAPTRALVTGIFSTFLTPGFLVTLRAIFLWGWWVLKKVMTWHLIVFKNLAMPRHVAFPTLVKEHEKNPT